MNAPRLLLAALGAFVVYFILGGIFFAGSPLKKEFMQYPAVYRTQESMKGVWPVGLAGMLLSMIALAALYAWTTPGASTLAHGAEFGALVALYALGSFVLHNHVNLNIGWRLTLGQAIAYSIQWVVVGMVLGMIY